MTHALGASYIGLPFGDWPSFRTSAAGDEFDRGTTMAMGRANVGLCVLYAQQFYS